jgi:predicted Zn finger-like uncharacterized protein
MILACPACKTRFEIDVTRLGAKSRLVRCGQCAHQWRQAPERAPDEAVAAPPEKDPLQVPSPELPVSEAAPRSAAPRERVFTSGQAVTNGVKPMSSSGAGLGWVLLLVFVGGLGGFAYFGRDLLVAKVPQMSQLYALAGWSVGTPNDGLSLENVTSVRRLISGDRVLIIEGEVLNISNAVVSVPRLRASLNNSDGDEISFWYFSAEDTELGPGESTRFETSTNNPPKSGKNLSISLNSDG